MNKPLSTEEFFKNRTANEPYSSATGGKFFDEVSIYDLKDFARQWVRYALEQVAEKATTQHIGYNMTLVDKQSIINAVKPEEII